MKLEEAIRRVLSFQTEYVDRTIVDEEELKETDLNNYAINMVTYTLETSIPRAVIEEKLKQLEEIRRENVNTRFVLEYSMYNAITNEIDDLQKILNKGE